MTCKQLLSRLLAAAAVGWGCGKNQTGTPASIPGMTLEARVAKLEQDLKAAQNQASDLGTKFRAEQARGKVVEKERDDLQVTLKTRTTERDTLQNQYDGFRKGLKDLLGQAEAAQAQPSTPVVPTGATGPSAAVTTAPEPRGLQ